jgi:hypothetical protein
MMQWRSQDGALTLQYDPRVLEEIRADVMAAMYGAASGAREAGGLLLGRRSGEAEFHLEGWRPVRCDHTRGPSFLLSSRDAAILGMQAAELGERVIGWFVSHARGEMGMRAEEQQLHSKVLPQTAALFMTFCPGRFGDALLHFHLVEGGRRTEVPGQLLLPPLPELVRAATVDRQPAEERAAPKRRWNRRKWALPAAAGVTGLVFVAAGWYLWRGPERGVAAAPVKPGPTGVPERILTLHIEPVGGRLEISWDPLAGDAPGAVAALTVADQGRTFVRRLKPEELKLGRIQYTRPTSEIRVALLIERPGKPPLLARSHYQGPAPEPER